MVSLIGSNNRKVIAFWLFTQMSIILHLVWINALAQLWIQNWKLTYLSKQKMLIGISCDKLFLNSKIGIFYLIKKGSFFQYRNFETFRYLIRSMKHFFVNYINCCSVSEFSLNAIENWTKTSILLDCSPLFHDLACTCGFWIWMSNFWKI